MLYVYTNMSSDLLKMESHDATSSTVKDRSFWITARNDNLVTAAEFVTQDSHLRLKPAVWKPIF